MDVFTQGIPLVGLANLCITTSHICAFENWNNIGGESSHQWSPQPQKNEVPNLKEAEMVCCTISKKKYWKKNQLRCYMFPQAIKPIHSRHQESSLTIMKKTEINKKSCPHIEWRNIKLNSSDAPYVPHNGHHLMVVLLGTRTIYEVKYNVITIVPTQ
jgi:hypothetical protein